MDTNKEFGKKLAKAIETSKEYYSIRSILGYSWANIICLLGGREAGKSWAVLDFFLYEFFTKGKDFVWLRLTEASTKKLLNNNAMQFIDAGLMIKYHINSTDLTVKGTTVFYKGRKMARIMALSTFYSDKGVANFEDKKTEMKFEYNIACDEFQREKNERNTFDICYAFVNEIENLVRHKTTCRIFLIGNTTEECSDILSGLLNFIPEQWGRYKLKSKRAVIDYMPPSNKYLERRKGSIAQLLMPDASTFTNKQTFDRSKIFKGRLHKPGYIIQFRNDSFTVWDGNIIARYNKENRPVIAMVPLLINNSVFKSELRDEVILMNYEKKYLFKDLLTQKLFDKCIKEVKGIKG